MPPCPRQESRHGERAKASPKEAPPRPAAPSPLTCCRAQRDPPVPPAELPQLLLVLLQPPGFGHRRRRGGWQHSRSGGCHDRRPLLGAAARPSRPPGPPRTCALSAALLPETAPRCCRRGEAGGEAAFPAHPRLSGVSRKPGGRLAPPQKGAEEAAAGGGTWLPPLGSRAPPGGSAGHRAGMAGERGPAASGVCEPGRPPAKGEKGLAARGCEVCLAL